MDDKEFKKFCLDLRCPICGSQLDGNLKPKRADLYCVSDNQEFMISYFPEDDSTNHQTFAIKFFPNEYIFTSKFRRDGGFQHSTVKLVNMELHRRIGLNEAKTLLNVSVNLSHLAAIKDEKEMVAKLKLYNTFS